MANIFNCIPGLNKALSANNDSYNNDAESSLMDKLNNNKSLMSSGSFFVSGAIPSILWILILIVLFNFIVAPLLNSLGFNIQIGVIPEWYSQMCSTIVLGLLAKKAWDSTDVTAGSFSKKSKYESESNTETKNIGNIISGLKLNIENNNDEINKNMKKNTSAKTIPKEIQINSYDVDGNIDNLDDDDVDNNPEYEDKSYIDKKFNELDAKYNE